MKVKFIDSSHTYWDENGKELISVSKFYKKFEPFVDWDTIAEKYAKKLNKKDGTSLSGEDVRKMWKEKAEKSTMVGTLLHSIKEQELIDSQDIMFYDTKCSLQTCDFSDGVKFSIPINDLRDNTVYPELMIYDFENGICGQSDLVVITNGMINIRDFKTDKEISFKGFSTEWTSARKLKEPISHLDDCNGNQYSLKMSMYMYMLWKQNKAKFKTGEIVIDHVKLERDEEGVPILKDGKPVVLSITPIKVPYLKKEVEAMLKTINK